MRVSCNGLVFSVGDPCSRMLGGTSEGLGSRRSLGMWEGIRLACAEDMISSYG